MISGKSNGRERKGEYYRKESYKNLLHDLTSIKISYLWIHYTRKKRVFKKFDDFDPDDYRRQSPRFQGENFAKNLQLVDKVSELASRKGVTPGQLALAWVLAQGKDIVPIPGTKRVKYIEEKVRATDIHLTPEELDEIGHAIPRGAVSGERYPAQTMVSLTAESSVGSVTGMI